MELKLAVMKRTLPENATTLEKVKAEIPDAQRCKIPHDLRKSVDKAIYDTFWILSNDQIYMEFSDDFTVPLVSRQRSEEPFGWKNLLVGAGRGANCEHTKGLLTNRDTGQRQEHRRTDL